ncbi:MAG: leucine-rich repeat domain-containing protein [Clostridia bacterium]|nr:leucine-rich repeat domain-containing protein [Clostridia bacterium]
MRSFFRKSIVVLFAAALVCLLAIGIGAVTDTVTASGTCGDDLTWTLYDDGELVISGTGEMTGYYSTSYAPWHGYRFRIESVTVEPGVTSIGFNAFIDCSNIISVAFPDSVTKIAAQAFYGCSSLNNVDIPVDVKSIGNHAFYYCSNLTKAIIYSCTATFGSNVFNNTPTTFEIHGYTGSTAEAYANANDHIFVAHDAAPEPFGLSGVTMTLGSSLSLDFAVDTSKLTGTDNYAEFTIVYADGRDSETVTVPQSEWTKYSGTVYTAKFTGMAAKQMNDVVTAVFYNANGQQLTIEKSDSIETYSIRMLNGNAASNKKLRTVYVDMLNYGAAAQVQFDYDETNLANRNLTDIHKAWATAVITTIDKRVKGPGYIGTALTLSDEIQLDLVFRHAIIGSDYSKLYAIATYTDHYGNDKEIRIEGTDFIKYSSSMCQISITGMSVADFRSVVMCRVYNSTGTELGYGADSIESYVFRNAVSLAEIVDAIAKFSHSSYNYFH